MSISTPARPQPPSQTGTSGAFSSAPPALHQLPQPVASSSRNPQLGPKPFFRYPTPAADQVEDELPPYWESENVPLGLMLDRLTHKGYKDMRTLVEQTLPPLATRQKPKHIIEYAKTTRQAVLKYLAVLRWKTTVDLATAVAPPGGGTGAAAGHAASFPTPHSNGESNDTSPTSYPSKGKARGDGGASSGDEPVLRGKVTDARRIQQFLEHQNAQHEVAIEHVRHVTKLVETLRERNADLVTALSVRATGTYSRLPTALTESFIPKPPLNPPLVLDTVERLNEHLLYRLRCIDYVPAELKVERVSDGRVHVRGGGPNGWLAELSVVGFEDDSRWWLTGVKWAWRPEGSKAAKTFTQEELQQILDLANMELLAPRPLPEPEEKDKADGADKEVVDSPLVRIYNFLQHLSLAYQLEVLFTQAMTLSQGRWRGHLLVDMDRTKKELRVRYWHRARPQQQPPAAGGKRAPQPAGGSSGRGPATVTGGTLTFTLGESATPVSEAERVLREVASCGEQPVDRPVRLEIGVKWEVGEAGSGGGLKAGEAMDASGLKIDPSALSMKDILTTATRAHASHLARSTMTPLLSNVRLTLDPLNPPRFVESESSTSTRPLSLIVPLPSQHGGAHFAVSVSATTGLIDIEDSTARENGQVVESTRTIRARLATASVNDQKTRLADDLYRLLSAVIMEDVEDNLRRLGLYPLRRVALRTHDLSKTDLHPTSTAFVPLPVSPSHYFVSKVTPNGIAFELLKLLRVPMDNGGGLKMSVGDRTPIDLNKLAARRKAKSLKRDLDAAEGDDPLGIAWQTQVAAGVSRFHVSIKDLRDMFFYCNALVAQTIVEQQLKDRGILYTTHFPDESDFTSPRSRSALAGMVPIICVNATDLFKDSRSAEVAAPKVFLVINDWWKGTQCTVETIVQLRHRPSVSPNDSHVAPASSSAARADGIKFDQATSTVRFRAPNLAQSVSDFLKQWERLSKVIVVAGEVNRINKTEQFHDIRMLSFDFCTATLQYAPGYQAAITYTPTSDSYEVSFYRSSAVTSTPAEPSATPAVDVESSPHQLIAPLLSAYLNEATSQAGHPSGGLGIKGKQFIQLLRATLPLLLEVESLRAASPTGQMPALVVRSVESYRLVWDVEGTRRYALDVALSSDGLRFLISDATRICGDALPDLSCGPLTTIPGIERAVAKGFQAARAAKVATPGSVSVYGTPAAATPAAGAAAAAAARKVGSVMPPALRLDSGTSILCTVNVVQDVLKAMATEIETALSSTSK